MLTTRIHKLLGDLSVNKLRTSFVILAIFLGCFGFSVVANSYAILMREMDRNYMNTNPASATLWTEPISEQMLQKIADLPYIKDAGTTEKVVGRIAVGENEWKDIWLFVVPDFQDVKIDAFFPEEGKVIPATGEILLERKALSIANAEVGQSVNVKVPGGVVTALSLTGTVHAPGLAPAWMEGYAYGYITPETLKLLGGTTHKTALKIIADGDTLRKEQNRETAYRLKEFLQSQGINTLQIEVPLPGRHPHYSQMATLLFLMEAFGLLALGLSGVLTANLISFLVEQQKRQIGIMKAIGASSMQIAGLYQSMVLVLSAVALAVVIPCGIYAGRGYARVASTILNFNIISNNIPHYIIMLEVAVGLIVPFATAAFPIHRGSRTTVREAIQDYGIRQEKFSGKDTDRALRLTAMLPRPFMLSLRNTLRRKGRLAFTIIVMAVGGTGFLLAMNIYASMYNTVDAKMASIEYDIQIVFTNPLPEAEVQGMISSQTGVLAAETWGGARASIVYDDGMAGDSFGVIAPASYTAMMSPPPLYSGRWLAQDDTNSVVINQQLLAKEPGVKVGDEILLRINGRDVEWRIIGISKELIGLPTAYVNENYLTQLLGLDGYVNNAIVVTDAVGAEDLAAIAANLEEKLSEKGYEVRSLVQVDEYREALEDHLVIIASLLIMMSVLVGIVGGLGLATTVSINVMERTKEIGVMRAIGASTCVINGINVIEGMLIGAFSWIISTLVSWPLSQYISNKFGMIFFEAPLEFAVSGWGLVLWLAFVLGFAALASYSPSRKAVQLQVREALIYE